MRQYPRKFAQRFAEAFPKMVEERTPADIVRKVWLASESELWGLLCVDVGVGRLLFDRCHGQKSFGPRM